MFSFSSVLNEYTVCLSYFQMNLSLQCAFFCYRMAASFYTKVLTFCSLCLQPKHTHTDCAVLRFLQQRQVVVVQLGREERGHSAHSWKPLHISLRCKLAEHGFSKGFTLLIQDRKLTNMVSYQLKLFQCFEKINVGT